VNFLQAHAAVKGLRDGKPLRFTLVCSGVTATLELFLRAHAAQEGFDAQVDTIPFNSLAQRIRIKDTSGMLEVFLLLPWDLLPVADWRTGLPGNSVSYEQAEVVLSEHVQLLSQRSAARFVYLQAPIPPLGTTAAAARALETQVLAAARRVGAAELPRQCFNLASYFETGNPLASQSLSEIAGQIIQAALAARREPKKVLVTDLDNTLWNGVIGEDGVDGIAYGPEGRGYPFFAYQSLLHKLRQEGTILAAVSRNDADLALAPFKRGQMTLREADFVAIIASYNSKSAQISQLAQELNLGLDSFVFVDDNPIELEEVGRALPSVERVLFEGKPAALPDLFERLTALFGKATLTEEDTKRTEMYRARLGSAVPSTAAGADLTEFLSSLEMKLTIRERALGDHARCLQLINKTNQFNFNGRRLSEAELESTLTAGGHLIGVTLDDRNGTHGEVIACLIDAAGTVESFVMSCRVFQRRAEFAFVAWLAAQSYAPREYRYIPTERNEPVRMFLEQLQQSTSEGLIPFEGQRVAMECASDLALFRVTAT
jgi:FkbH-like protein